MVTDAGFDTQVLKSPLPVLMFSWAPWCPSCGAMMPIIDEFARDTRGRVRVAKLNLDPNPRLTALYDIRSVPFIFIIDNGRLRESFPGGMQKHELMMKMATYV